MQIPGRGADVYAIGASLFGRDRAMEKKLHGLICFNNIHPIGRISARDDGASLGHGDIDVAVSTTGVNAIRIASSCSNRAVLAQPNRDVFVVVYN